VLEIEAIGDRDSSLTEITHLVDMPAEVGSDGWSGESARLFALDLAMTAIQRNLTALDESERQVLIHGLQQARTLVVGGRDDEIGFLQEIFEARLRLASPDKRMVLLSALDALIPDPYRAALVSVRDTLDMGGPIPTWRICCGTVSSPASAKDPWSPSPHRCISRPDARELV
jgi:hypothetical protein